MRSANTIRTCSTIMEVITIIASFLIGLVVFSINSNLIVITIVIWVAGIFGAVMQNALFQGFADLIDNSYISARRACGLEAKDIKDYNGQILYNHKYSTNKKETK